MSRFLILVPTEFELRILLPLIERSVKAAGGDIAVCGFGPIVAGIGTARLLAEREPESVILCGIAGALSERLGIGSATTFSQVACYGIGVGSGSDFQTVGELGWDRWNAVAGSMSFGDVIEIHNQGASSEATSSKDRQLLTACSASAGQEDVRLRLRTFPDAIAEDMEAYSVAVSCQLAGIPLTVVRGISNVAGDREKARWKIEAALEAAADLLLKVIR